MMEDRKGPQSQCLGERVDRWLELLVVWVLVTSAIGLLATLAGHFLAPQICLTSILLTGIYAWRTAKSKAPFGVTPNWQHLLLLSLVCLLFRVPAYHYVLGGQDEGVYVNVAHYIERTGGIKVSDTALEKLQHSPATDTYLAENRQGYYLPGVYERSPTGTRLEFQFYHLFPVWMALFGGIFGATFGVYALTFFAWLSVMFFYRLALAISQSSRAALIAGLLLALNPLHAFFSKFPVTEVPALAFSLIGFTYIAAFWGGSGSGFPSGRRWLWISAAGFAALFATRISGFMYVPFVIALAAAGTLMDRDRVRQKSMFLWASGVVVLYAISVLYGLRWSGHYARDIYRLSFDAIFGGRWLTIVASIAAVCVIGWLALTFLARSEGSRERMRRYFAIPARRVIGLVVLLGLSVGLFNIYRLGWTGHYLHDHWLDDIFGIAGSQAGAISASSLFAFLVYLGPLIPACFLVLVVRRQEDPRLEYLRLFAAGFFVYVVALQWYILYGPYYTRYLLSEAVPYMSLFVVLAWASMTSMRWKRLLTGVLAVSLIYMGFASASQLGKNEQHGMYGELKKLLSPIDSSDLLLIDWAQSGRPFTNELKTPIVYTFGLNAITISSESLAKPAYIASLASHYDDTFLVSQSAAAPEGFNLVGSTRVQDWSFKQSFLYPHELVLLGERRLYLYRLSGLIFPLSEEVPFGTAGGRNDWLASGWNAPESWGVWSLGQEAELAIDPRQLPEVSDGLRLTFSATMFVTSSHPHQRIVVALNGVTVGHYEVTYPNSVIKIAIDIPREALQSTRKIRVSFDLPDAVSPQSIGLSHDGRVVGMGLRTVTAMPISSDASTDASKKSADDSNHLDRRITSE